MKKVFVLLLFTVLFVIALLESIYIYQAQFRKYDIIKEKIVPKPLLSYTFENLRKTNFLSSPITLGEIVNENSDSISQMFYFNVPSRPNEERILKASGLTNIPKNPGNYPVIIMFRGFVPDDIHAPGVGTQPSANELVKNGFITLAPDFLGFGESSSASAEPFESRFQTYTTALTLLKSVNSLNEELKIKHPGIIADINEIGIWGHSNGGHIALSILAITEGEYPTVLWAPVSKSFPYSILYYTDEFDDQGKELRKYLSDFEEIYNTNQFSPTNYYKWIKAPIQINQGTADQEVPYWWSNELVENLEKEKINVEYLKYLDADHNLRPAWNEAINNTINFYKQNFSL